MASLEITTPSREPGWYRLPSSPSPSRSQWTFTAQRAEFTKPVPPALLPVYPDFPRDSTTSDDENSMPTNNNNNNRSTRAMATSQGQRSLPSIAGEVYQDGVDTMATTHESAEKSGISPTSKSTNPLHRLAAGLNRSTVKLDHDIEAKPERNSNSVIAKLASFLGLQRRQQERHQDGTLPSVFPSRTGTPFPSLSQPKYSPFSSPRSDSGSSLSAINSLFARVPDDSLNTSMSVVIEDDCELPYDSAIGNEQLQQQGEGPAYSFATYPPPTRPRKPLRHRRSRSLDIVLAFSGVGEARSTRLRASNQPPSMEPPSHSRSRSVDSQLRREQSISMDRISSCFATLPPHCLLVQVWAVGLDESDRQLAIGSDGCMRHDQERKKSHPTGSTSLAWPWDLGTKKKEKEPTLGWLSRFKPLSTPHPQSLIRDGKSISVPEGRETRRIPGQSFVGRVLKTGSDVDKSFAARNDWVAGLIDIRKCVPLAELTVIDWRQVRRVSRPPDDAIPSGSTPLSEPSYDKSRDDVAYKPSDEDLSLRFSTPLTLEELALLPLCGIPAYRAVKTCIGAFPADHNGFNGMAECSYPTRRRALVLRGHDGAGAMAVQMLIQQDWRVSVHVPFSRVPWDATQAEADEFMLAVEDRLKKWGVDEVIYDDANSYADWDGEMDDRKAAVVRVIETLRADGDVFDAVLDFVGGKEIREAGERLLGLNGSLASHGVGHFLSLVGDPPDDPTSLPADHFWSRHANPSTLTLHDPRSYANDNEHSEDIGRGVKYTQMRGVFESEDEDVYEILDAVLRLALEDGIRPRVEEVGGEIFRRPRVVPFEKASDILADGDLLSDGGQAVVRVVDFNS